MARQRRKHSRAMLLVVGGQDALPPTVTQENSAQIPGAQFVVIPQVGHLTNLAHPAVFL
ncbi:MAG TPA: alpha/beta hydrolase [Ktedonosporobacter sp.]|nr:alpha/beta hydrolase [Ktedonosporobacter sp.]